MPRVVFLEVPHPPLERTACHAVARLVGQEHRVVVRARDATQAARLDELLWTFDPGAFLAHRRVAPGADVDGAPEAALVVPGELDWPAATALVLAGPLEPAQVPDRYDVVIDFAIPYDEALLEASRARFRAWRERGVEPEYKRRGSGA